MPESQSHKRTKKRLAGQKGKTEVKTLGAKIAVPNKDMRQAAAEMRKQRLSGRVENLSNSRSFYVKAAQSKSKRSYSRRKR